MFVAGLFLLALVASFLHSRIAGVRYEHTLLRYILLFNMGVMGLLAAYAHVYMAAATAKEIGWQPGSPFQFEVAMANLSYGVLGLVGFWLRGRFAAASVIGWSILLLGCFVGHMLNYYETGNIASYNIGVFVWFNDLFLPLLTLGLLVYTSRRSLVR